MYTFGAPRVGNHAFARECRGKLPELWNVINDQVAAPQSTGALPDIAKYLMYKLGSKQKLAGLAGPPGRLQPAHCAALPKLLAIFEQCGRLLPALWAQHLTCEIASEHSTGNCFA